MAENITIRINNNLDAIFNVENDDIYKSVISDTDGVTPGTITIPTDINIGAIASQIEYLRILSASLIKQMYINQATGDFLRYELEEFFNCLQFLGESEVQWVARALSLTFQPRVSKGSIIAALTPYSSPAPTIENLRTDSGFADVSFADIYDTYVTTFAGDDFYVYSARSSEFGSSFFAINITMYNFTGSLQAIVNIINAYIAAGITFTIDFVTI